MGHPNDLPMGFDDPVVGAQLAFRAALHALSRPGGTVECPTHAPKVAGLMPATVALLLALTDHETPVWWAALSHAPWLRFHTGAPTADRPADASFVVVAQAHDQAHDHAHDQPQADSQTTAPAPALPELAGLNAGTDVSPERSATLLLELPSLAGGPPAVWSGPGLREPVAVCLAGLASSFWPQWQANHARFPRGVDVFFIHGHQIVGLPRTTLVRPGEAR